MADSGGSVNTAGSDTAGKPSDLCWKIYIFSALTGLVDKNGKAAIQLVNSWAHKTAMPRIE